MANGQHALLVTAGQDCPRPMPTGQGLWKGTGSHEKYTGRGRGLGPSWNQIHQHRHLELVSVPPCLLLPPCWLPPLGRLSLMADQVATAGWPQSTRALSPCRAGTLSCLDHPGSSLASRALGVICPISEPQRPRTAKERKPSAFTEGRERGAGRQDNGWPVWGKNYVPSHSHQTPGSCCQSWGLLSHSMTGSGGEIPGAAGMPLEVLTPRPPAPQLPQGADAPRAPRAWSL